MYRSGGSTGSSGEDAEEDSMSQYDPGHADEPDAVYGGEGAFLWCGHTQQLGTVGVGREGQQATHDLAVT